MSAFTELLAAHAPYISASATSLSALQCHECLDGRGNGEFTSTEAWADHITAELAVAGLRVTTRKPAKVAEQESLL